MEDLRTVLTKHGFRFKKQFGQNFISDTNLLKSIVSASGVTKDTTVVEIGCGAGTLTRALAESAKRVYAFDIDADLKPVLEETLAGVENVEVIFRDFHKLDLKEFEKEIIERKSDSEYDVTILLNMYLTLAFVKEFGFKAGEAWSEITEYAYGCLSYSDFATTEMLIPEG